MKPEEYLSLKETLLSIGYDKEITWAETVRPPRDAESFFAEYAWVVLNSGMKNQVAWKIWERIKGALHCALPVCAAFNHPGKSKAIQEAWERREEIFRKYLAQADDQKLAWLEALPWIGPITKYHLGKNLGMDLCKPDRHMVRIAGGYRMTPEELCSTLARVTGDRIGTVDYVLWRSANLGLI